LHLRLQSIGFWLGDKPLINTADKPDYIMKQFQPKPLFLSVDARGAREANLTSKVRDPCPDFSDPGGIFKHRVVKIRNLPFSSACYVKSSSV
jgi:hypothetical protein